MVDHVSIYVSYHYIYQLLPVSMYHYQPLLLPTVNPSSRITLARTDLLALDSALDAWEAQEAKEQKEAPQKCSERWGVSPQKWGFIADPAFSGGLSHR